MSSTEQFEMGLLQKHLEIATTSLRFHWLNISFSDISECELEAAVRKVENLLLKMNEIRSSLDHALDAALEIDSDKREKLLNLQRGSVEDGKMGYIEAIIFAENALIEAKVRKEEALKQHQFRSHSLKSLESASGPVNMVSESWDSSSTPHLSQQLESESNKEVSCFNSDEKLFNSECASVTEVHRDAESEYLKEETSESTSVSEAPDMMLVDNLRSYDKLFFDNIINSVVADLKDISQVTFKYLSEKYPEFLTRLKTDLPGKLCVHLALIKLRNMVPTLSLRSQIFKLNHF